MLRGRGLFPAEGVAHGSRDLLRVVVAGPAEAVVTDPVACRPLPGVDDGGARGGGRVDLGGQGELVALAGGDRGQTGHGTAQLGRDLRGRDLVAEFDTFDALLAHARLELVTPAALGEEQQPRPGMLDRKSTRESGKREG